MDTRSKSRRFGAKSVVIRSSLIIAHLPLFQIDVAVRKSRNGLPNRAGLYRRESRVHQETGGRPGHDQCYGEEASLRTAVRTLRAQRGGPRSRP